MNIFCGSNKDIYSMEQMKEQLEEFKQDLENSLTKPYPQKI